MFPELCRRCKQIRVSVDKSIRSESWGIYIIIIIIILGLCYHFSPLWRNPSLDSFHWCLSWANLVQVVPRCRLRSSLHLVFGLPRGLNHLRGTQDVALMVHLLSWSLATWPAHRCFDCLMWSMMSVTPVCCRIQVLCLWSRRVMPSIILSIFLCATASASIWAVVKAQVSLPYVITGSTYSLNTFFFDLHACFAASHDAVYLVEGGPSQSDTSLDLWH